MKNNKMFLSGISGVALIFILFYMGCKTDTDEPGCPCPSQTNDEITNNIGTLGIVGTSARSSSDAVAVAEVKGEKIVITSKGKGLATITVIGPDDKSDAEIEIRTDENGNITTGRILKGGEPVITISGTYGGAYVAGTSCPATLLLHFAWDVMDIRMDGPGDWSVKHFPFDNDVPLWFEVEILTAGTFEGSAAKRIRYQTSLIDLINNQSKKNIAIPRVDIPNLITLSGTANTTLTGTWKRTKQHTNVNVVNKSIATGNFYDVDSLEAGWVAARTSVANGNWELSIPASAEDTDISFSVQMESSGSAENWNYLSGWEVGQKNNLNPISVNTQNKSGIVLGTIPFVMVNGTTPATVNGTRPFMYRIDFGYYGYWNQEEGYWDQEGANGWTGATGILHEANETGSEWSVPMPANTKLEASIEYWEKSRIQFRENSGSVAFNTSTVPYSLDLSSISAIIK